MKKKVRLSEYDPKKKYSEDTEFVLDDSLLEDIPIPDFLKKNDDEEPLIE